MVQLFQYRSIGTTEVRLISSNPVRTGLVLYNNHATQVIYLNRSQGVSTTNGFPIPAGGSVVMKIPEDDPRGELWAIADGAATDLRFVESFGIPPKEWQR